MKVRFLNLAVSEATEKRALLKCFAQVLDHGQLVMGPEVETFENALALRCSRKFCVSVGSGTDALYLSLRSLGIGIGDEVVTTSLSWIATANAIALTGATPVFADINPDLNINVASARRLISARTKAILFVNYTGRMCDIAELETLSLEKGVDLIEDGSQSFGATYSSRPCGSIGRISAISHNPMKILAACGEAGSILCDDKDIYDKLKSLRYNGTINRETCIEPSLNARMDTVQAAILQHRLNGLEDVIRVRRRNAQFFDSQLRNYVDIPVKTEDREDVYYTYTLQTTHRDELQKYLTSKSIETKIQHVMLMPQQPAYATEVKAEIVFAKNIVRNILCIPIHENLTKNELTFVAETIRSFFD